MDGIVIDEMISPWALSLGGFSYTLGEKEEVGLLHFSVWGQYVRYSRICGVEAALQKQEGFGWARAKPKYVDRIVTGC